MRASELTAGFCQALEACLPIRLGEKSDTYLGQSMPSLTQLNNLRGKNSIIDSQCTRNVLS